MGLLDGKVAVVTGAGRGIGREEALLLAAEGARVVVNDVGAGLHGEGSGDVHPAEEVVALIRENGGEAAVNGDDISSWAGGKNVVEQAIDTFGSLDILVNNAGILRDKMSFNMDESDWDDVIRVHLKGHFAATHHAAVYWRNRAKARRGRDRPHHQHHVGVGPLRQRRARPTTPPPRRASRPSPWSRPASSAATA